MKTNSKTQHSTTQPIGMISKCLQQMINVTSSVKPTKKHQTYAKTFMNRSKPLKTLPEMDENENPREFVPFPESNHSFNKRLSLNDKKTSQKTKIDHDLNNDFDEIVKKVKEVRIEEMNLKKVGLKNKKDWEYSLILEDFKFRLLEKVFFSFLQKKIRWKKKRKSSIECYLEKSTKQRRKIVFGIIKDFAVQRKKKQEFQESMKTCMYFHIQKVYLKKWLAWFLQKSELNKKKEKIFEASLFYSLKSRFKKMNEYRFYAKNFRLFIRSRKLQLLSKCFKALKSDKLTLSTIQEKISSLKHDEYKSEPIKFNFYRSKIYFTKKIAKEIRSVKLTERILFQSISLNDKFTITKGKINLEEVKKMFFRKTIDLLKRKAFYSLKLVHLENKKELLALNYQELKLKTKLFQALKLNKKVILFNDSQKTRWAQLFYVNNLKKRIIQMLKNKSIIKKARLKAYLLAKTFNLMKKYTNYKRNKNECLLSISKAYAQKFKSKALHKWFSIVRKLQPVNDLYKTNLKKRYLLKLMTIFKQKQLLKKYLKLISIQDESKISDSSPFRLLKELFNLNYIIYFYN